MSKMGLKEDAEKTVTKIGAMDTLVRIWMFRLIEIFFKWTTQEEKLELLSVLGKKYWSGLISMITWIDYILFFWKKRAAIVQKTSEKLKNKP